MLDRRREPRAGGKAAGRPRKNATVLTKTIRLHRGNNAWEELPPFEPAPPSLNDEEKRLLMLKLGAGLDNDGIDFEEAVFETFDTSTSPPRLVKTNVPPVQLTVAERCFLVDLLTPKPEKAEREQSRRLAIKLRASTEAERIAKCVHNLMVTKHDGGPGLTKTAAIRAVAKMFKRSVSSIWAAYRPRADRPRADRLERQYVTPNHRK
jgi:hypothetical protein